MSPTNLYVVDIELEWPDYYDHRTVDVLAKTMHAAMRRAIVQVQGNYGDPVSITIRAQRSPLRLHSEIGTR